MSSCLERRLAGDLLGVGAEALEGLDHDLLDLLFGYGCAHEAPFAVVAIDVRLEVGASCGMGVASGACGRAGRAGYALRPPST